MIFVTVGTAYPFDRLIRAMDEHVRAGRVTQPVFAQIGTGSYEPKYMPFQRFVDKTKFDELMSSAQCIVSHAGIGSMATAFNLAKPVLVVPRRAQYHECVNDHQVGTARRFSERGHVLAAFDADEIPSALEALPAFRPVPRDPNAKGIATRVGQYFDSLSRLRQ